MDFQPLSQLVDLSGKTAIVTGGATGIGFGIAYRLAEAGAAVVVADVNASAAETAARKLRDKRMRAAAMTVDIADAAQIDQMVEFTQRTFGGVDILVNNAGIYPTIPVMRMEAADFDRIISVNLRGAFLAI
jgi:2-deoxy-D-gluconate 3-dehydrogenase